MAGKLPTGAIPIDELQEEDFQPKWYLNGFPKSGLHWLALMLAPVAKPQFEDHRLWTMPWAGSFMLNSWTDREVPLERMTYKIGRLADGQYLKGHCAYSDEVERFLWYLGAACIFIFRDFRDVAVSQAYHVLSEDDDRMAHPDKDLYKTMDSFEDVLRAVIVGTTGSDGVVYPGVMERWQYYAGWLDADWVLKLRFENLKADTHQVAMRILRYGLRRASSIFLLEPQLITAGLETVAGWMVQAGKQKDKSPTFRKGAVGDWQEHFTPELARLFEETDWDNWLVQLGYAEEGWANDVSI